VDRAFGSLCGAARSYVIFTSRQHWGGPALPSTWSPVYMKIFSIAFLLLLAAPAIAQTSSGYLDQSSNWKWEHDTGTPGTSTGQLIFGVGSPSLDRSATEFLVSYSDYGGERFHLAFGNDTAATYFVYDTYVYLVNPTQVQNLELDMNQVTSNGETIIFGTQCSSISGTWEYTYASSGHAHWKPSNLPCNPQNWAPNKWHHVQIQSHRVGDVVTYDWVKVDNERQRSFKGATAPSGLYLGWNPLGVLLINFQIDGAYSSSGTIQGYLDKLQIWRW
jgi:hypothetical protein